MSKCKFHLTYLPPTYLLYSVHPEGYSASPRNPLLVLERRIQPLAQQLYAPKFLQANELHIGSKYSPIYRQFLIFPDSYTL